MGTPAISPTISHHPFPHLATLPGRWAGLTLLLTIGASRSVAAAEVTEAMWQELVTANQQLRALVDAQNEEIAALRSRVDRLDQVGNRQTAEVNALHDRLDRAPPVAEVPRTTGDQPWIFSGEAGIAFFAGQSSNQYSNAEFRVDDALLRFDAEVARNVFVSSELELARRENRDENLHLGEFYVEFEDIGGDATPGRPFNLRLGRVDVPFGEEYQERDPLANPLINHSVTDIWGTDEGIELHGVIGRAAYAVAVQNGNGSSLRDFTSDKSVAVRLGFAPLPQLRLSASAMRTGALDRVYDSVSEIWFGNTLFRSIGSAATTRFRAELAEFDVAWSWTGGRVWAAIGRAAYADDDPLADNARDFDYHQVGIVHAFTPRLYGAVRHSAVTVDEGYPLVGLGSSALFLNGPRTTALRRLSLGGGFRLHPDLALKLEYTFERGRLVTGATRGDSDMLSAAAAVGF